MLDIDRLTQIERDLHEARNLGVSREGYEALCDALADVLADRVDLLRWVAELECAEPEAVVRRLEAERAVMDAGRVQVAFAPVRGAVEVREYWPSVDLAYDNVEVRDIDGKTWIRLQPKFYDPDDETIARIEAKIMAKYRGESCGRPIELMTKSKDGGD